MSRRPTFLCWALIVAGTTGAATFDAPPPGDSVIGEPQYVRALHEDTLVDLARLYDVGLNELRAANPEVDTWLPGEGTVVVIPTRYILPDTPRQGIVINVPEMRLYYYPEEESGPGPKAVITYPISVGRQDWETPKGVTRIVRKVRDPAWYPPASIRREHAADGRPLGKMVPPGPDNPLGGYALRLGIPGYLIHGTNRPNGVGMQVTHGCVRLYPEDIEHLFDSVSAGTPVRIVNQPYKLGWRDDVLYLEVHPPLRRDRERAADPQAVNEMIAAGLADREAVEVDWERVDAMVAHADGIPRPIARRISADSGQRPEQKNAPQTGPHAETATELYLETY